MAKISIEHLLDAEDIVRLTLRLNLDSIASIEEFMFNFIAI